MTIHTTTDTHGVSLDLPAGVQVTAVCSGAHRDILTRDALAFVADLERHFRERRLALLAARATTQERLDAGGSLDFLAETRSIREAAWHVGAIPTDLLDRTVEITGPVDRKMIINALNSGANVFMADFEDANSPTWSNTIEGQINLGDAIRRRIDFVHPDSGKTYRLSSRPATLMVRPRGWHMVERHVEIDGEPVSAGMFDFGLFLFHNVRELIRRGSGPYFYLPKIESYREARLWNDVFLRAQQRLGIDAGTIKATVLIETITAAFQMDEILYELREHSVGLNCGRWDYIFSFIKRFRADSRFVLPDRGSVGMDRHFLRSYSQLLIQTCHRRGAHAVGGMAAQIPIKEDAEANGKAMAKVHADKKREARDGHDGTWVAHPGLIEIARAEFAAVRPPGERLAVMRGDVSVTAADLLRVPQGEITQAGLRQNLNVGVLYLEAWLRGSGCVPIHGLMEDAATAEISRTQVWQWIRHGARLDDGRIIDRDLFRAVLAEEIAGIREEISAERYARGRFDRARELFEQLIEGEELAEFLTIAAYRDICDQPPPLNSSSTHLTQQGRTTMSSRTFFDYENGVPLTTSRRWDSIRRDYSPEDVRRLRGTANIRYTLAEKGAIRLWDLLNSEDYVAALGALTGNQALQQVKAGLRAIYLSGWQVAADANLAGQMYPDQSLYPANSVPSVVSRINQALQRADQIACSEGDTSMNWFAPIVADAEAGFGGPLNAFELMKSMIEAGAAGVHFEDQLASEKKCGHLGGKVLVPTQQFIRTLNAARLAADVCSVPTVLVARTDADAAALLTSDIDERDRAFITGERTPEGFFRTRPGVEQAIARGLSYAPYADVLWCETSKPDLAQARRFAAAIHAEFPGKLLAYNCSPSFNWQANLDASTIATFQQELGAMGYKFQFVTLAGFHALNNSMFELADAYRDGGMAAYSELQQREFGNEERGYTATRHQREVGTGYFDMVTQAISQGQSSTTALDGSTENDQFCGSESA